MFTTMGIRLRLLSSGGWCLLLRRASGLPPRRAFRVHPNGPAPNGAATGALVTVTAAVKIWRYAGYQGSVAVHGERQAGRWRSGAVRVATSGPTQGQASFTTSSLTAGRSQILATFTDPSNTYSESFGTFVQRVDNTPTVTVNGTGSQLLQRGQDYGSRS